MSQRLKILDFSITTGKTCSLALGGFFLEPSVASQLKTGCQAQTRFCFSLSEFESYYWWSESLQVINMMTWKYHKMKETQGAWFMVEVWDVLCLSSFHSVQCLQRRPLFLLWISFLWLHDVLVLVCFFLHMCCSAKDKPSNSFRRGYHWEGSDMPMQKWLQVFKFVKRQQKTIVKVSP